ncbi:hypothetical protein FSB78_10555 [Sphingomonas ginsenosidivorax]|uniref:Uncharacterized protein n=1 Tax=Sphingomonas ginsenosidivorax TaxID=862135 RepID=A0A5C6UFT6_9SPHN|nr:hypothetical protein [Sphingomonas ginsenosidivorax]TXC71334.1 hypothetical protein FSB78_10555 [Sphingomonas ginsenosidivorax]
MGRRRVNRHQWADEPDRLLFHDQAHDIWAKLDWESSEFQSRLNSDPPIDVDGCVYLLQSACISAAAVTDWLRQDLQKAAGLAGASLDERAFRAEIDLWLPDLPLARAVANTFKHREYRDEGWGNAEIRLITVFEPEQRSRLDAAHGTDRFENTFAEEAAEATFRLAFRRRDDSREVDAVEFVRQLSSGALRLLDANSPGDERLFVTKPRNPSAHAAGGS